MLPAAAAMLPTGAPAPAALVLAAPPPPAAAAISGVAVDFAPLARSGLSGALGACAIGDLASAFVLRGGAALAVDTTGTSDASGDAVRAEAPLPAAEPPKKRLSCALRA